MLACARLGAVHSVVFGGFAPRELAIRIDDAQPKVILSASCGIEGAARDRLQAAARPGDRARRATSPSACLILQRPQAAATMVEGRDQDWADDGRRRRAGATACRCARPIRSTSSTRRAPRACRRASCATTAATRWRCSGRCRTCTASSPGDVYWAASDVGWVVGHSLHRLRAAAARLHDDPLRGQARRDARRGRVLARGRRARRADAVHRADRVPRDQEGGSRRRAARAVRPGRLRGAVPRRRAHRHRHLPLGARPARRPGHRPLVADRDRMADRGELHRHRAAAREAGLADEAGAGLRRADPARERGGGRRRRDGRDRDPPAAAAGRAADAVERRRAVRLAPTSSSSRATTSPATAATWTRTATCS